MVPLGACAKCQLPMTAGKGIVATGYLRCLHTSLPGLARATADIAANVGEATGIPPIGLVQRTRFPRSSRSEPPPPAEALPFDPDVLEAIEIARQRIFRLHG